MGTVIESFHRLYRLLSLGTWSHSGPRKTLPLDENQTPSVVPTAYLQTHTVGKRWDGSRSVEEMFVAPTIDTSNLEKEAAQLAEEISCHFEMRIQLFYQQLCLCYGSKMVLREQGAEAQAGMKGGSSSGQLAEAHSSTLPCLGAWEEEPQKDGLGAGGFPPISLGKGSSFYNQWNTTVKLPVFVNKADSALDFQTKFPGLGGQTFREYCTELLNKVSSEELNPKQGLQSFLDQIQNCLTFLEGRSPVFQYYLSVAKSYRSFIEVPENLEKLTFTKQSHLHYPAIQQGMWRQMKKEVKVYRQMETVHEVALAVLNLTGSESHLNCLVPGILLNVFPGSKDLYPLAHKMIAKENKARSETQVAYAVRLAEDPKIIRLAKAYFAQFPSSQALINALDGSDLNKNLFYQEFKEQASVVLGKTPQKLTIIFLTALPRLYAHLHATPESLAVRRFLCMHDSWFSYLTNGKQQLREYIQRCVRSEEVISEADCLVEYLQD